MAAALAKLVSEGKLKWQSRLADLLPDEFALEDLYTTNSITVEDALSHRSGMPRHDLSYGNSSTSELVQSLRYLPLTAEPRTTFQYCNTMLATAGHLVSKLTGRGLGSVLHEWFWKPIGMKSTFFDLPSALRESLDHLARGYYWVEDNLESHSESMSSSRYYVPEPYLDLSPLAGAGAIISSVNDYALWMKTILGASPKLHRISNSSSPIANEVYHSILSPRTIVDEVTVLNSDPNAFIDLPLYALGWFSTKFDGRRMVFHGGSLTGFGTELFIMPDDDFGIVTMGNTVATSNIAGQLIASIILRAKFRTNTSQQSLMDSTMQCTNHQSGPMPGTNIYTALKNDQGHADIREIPNRNHFPEKPIPSSSNTSYAGVYSHPAYGSVEVFEAPDATDVIHVVPSYHIWAYEMIFHRVEKGHTENSLFFNVDFWSPHGPFRPDPMKVKAPACGQSVGSSSSAVTCKEKVVWEKSPYAQNAIAFFRPGPNSHIDQLGIQLSPEMVERARKEDLSWTESMIWFTKER